MSTGNKRPAEDVLRGEKRHSKKRRRRNAQSKPDADALELSKTDHVQAQSRDKHPDSLSRYSPNEHDGHENDEDRSGVTLHTETSPALHSSSIKQTRPTSVSPSRDRELTVGRHIESKTTIPKNQIRNSNLALTHTDSSLTSKDRQKISDSKNKGKSKSKNKNKDGMPQSEMVEHKWLLARKTGGVFLDHDPVLTLDAQHILLLTKSDIQVYAASTSLLVRSISLDQRSSSCSCALSVSDPAIIFVGFTNGVIVAYNWTTGRRTGLWKTLLELKNIRHIGSSEDQHQLLTISEEHTQDSKLHQVTLEIKTKKVDVAELLSHPKLQTYIFQYRGGEYVVCAGRQELFIGQRHEGQPLNYIWSHFNTRNRISACDVRVLQKQSIKGTPAINVAVGVQGGSILLYDDLLNKLKIKDRVMQNTDIRGRRLHWHRRAPRALKWSQDGEYLVSGGDESVLVIWQLDTNEKQFLPHLTTSILNLSISSSGANYALRLGDNSILMLSTADLSPSTNIVGLGCGGDRGTTSPTLLHPIYPNRLMAAIPIRSVGPSTTGNVSHLQVYDIDTNLQLTRQALTRNLTTTVNVSPGGQPLQEPDITHMAISFDGQWLATIDEWTPGLADLHAMYLEDDSDKQYAHETTLRFWDWDAAENCWNPATRVDQPHGPSICSVLAISQHPFTAEFATIGADGQLKIWAPKPRTRDGISVKNKAGQIMYTWVCARMWEIEQDYREFAASSIVTGTLAYSNDGSVLAASWSTVSQDHRNVHFIDTKTDSLCLSQPRLLTRGPGILAFAGHLLLALSERFVIFDTITMSTSYSMTLDSKFTSSSADYEESNKFLAICPLTNTFAIGVNPPRLWREPAQLCVFSLENPDERPLADFSVPGRIRALLANSADRGYVLIDGDARVRKLTPSDGSVGSSARSMALTKHVEPNSDAVRAPVGLRDIFGGRRQEPDSEGEDRLREIEPAPMNPHEATSTKLEDILNISSTAAQPGINELFERVATAVSGTRVG